MAHRGGIRKQAGEMTIVPYTVGAVLSRSVASGRNSEATAVPSRSRSPAPASGLRLPDDGAKRGRRTDPSEGDAGDPLKIVARGVDKEDQVAA